MSGHVRTCLDIDQNSVVTSETPKFGDRSKKLLPLAWEQHMRVSITESTKKTKTLFFSKKAVSQNDQGIDTGHKAPYARCQVIEGDGRYH